MTTNNRLASLQPSLDADSNQLDQTIYKWEQGITGLFESTNEDNYENNYAVIATERERLRKAQLRRITPSVRRGLIRYLFVALDCSESANLTDYRPSRFQVCKDNVSKFINEFFDQNPISQLGLLVTRNRISERVSDLSGNSQHHITKLKKMMNISGIASLQNTIILAISALKHVPEYGHRELLIIYNSISTCDPSDIFDTINEAKKLKIRISIICLTGELYICRKITEETGGSFHVSINPLHFIELLSQFTIPQPELLSSNEKVMNFYTDFIYMGFPKRENNHYLTFLTNNENITLNKTSYVCPNCHIRTNDLPTKCKICSLQLNSSANIARSYHHLFPVDNYIEYINSEANNENMNSKSIITSNITENLIQKSNETSVISQPNIKLEEKLTLKLRRNGNNAMKISNETKVTLNESIQANEIVIETQTQQCYGCLEILSDKNLIMICNHCLHKYCIDCDLFIHESLHNCPRCNL